MAFVVKILDQVLLEGLEDAVKTILSITGVKTNLFLSGNPGAGKTTFVRALVKFLGSRDLALSPSFSLMNLYSFPEGTIYHLDLYRLDDIEEAFDLDIEEILYSHETKLIEWADKFPSLMKNGYQIVFEINQDFSRKITLLKV
ncbi:MAG TPA: tRNA (adenosine(37)-N6)-threonylcarbamoyltransferase complex ATPase subunit type 1 TsaE [Spirochaetia bacterium]|nr:MAG: tRNA (adenosine(37)-N6)-threonylcarbamoyltransferase complex ATPase subunit type 1 TsaE [Spirochaetes bacterium GWB1_36_13]HCL56108.1 tRNA (adenosine(37)-N6)-threonylcarbamoyltransferase complex ATPase subunit type 1 TsaE [Spirochaetia bacterium]